MKLTTHYGALISRRAGSTYYGRKYYGENLVFMLIDEAIYCWDDISKGPWIKFFNILGKQHSKNQSRIHILAFPRSAQMLLKRVSTAADTRIT